MSVQASAPAATVEKTNSLARVPAAFRLQFAVPSALLSVPLIVFFASWALAIAIGVTVNAVSEDNAPVYTGVAQATLWCLAFMAAYAGSHTFPFSLALSFSRRTYVLGTFGAFAAVSLCYGVAVATAAGLESLTDGFGLNTYNFDLPFLTQGEGAGIVPLGLFAAVLCLTVMFFGFTIVILYLRMGLMRLWTLLLGLIALVALGIILITLNEAWGSVYEWISAQNASSLTRWLLLPMVGLGLISYYAIRRATPQR